MSRRPPIRRLLRRGQRLARAGRIDEAATAFASAGKVADARLPLQHALALARAGHTDAALEASAAAVAAAPDDGVPAAFNGYLLLRAGQLERGAAEAARAAELAPANAIPPTLSATLDILRGDVVAGCRKLLDGTATDNLEILGWVLALVERAIHERVGTDSGAIPPEEESKEKPGDAADPPAGKSARWIARRGEKLLECGRPNAGARFLARAVELAPDNADHRAAYGAALFEACEFERAESELAKAPTDGLVAGVAQFYRAANAYRLGRHEQALELLDTLPLTGDAVLYQEWFDYVRGMALVALGRTDEAAVPLAAFLDTEPDLLERRARKAIEIFSEANECSTPS